MTSLFFNLAKLKENADPFVLEQEGMLSIPCRQQHHGCVSVSVYECVCACECVRACAEQRWVT